MLVVVEGEEPLIAAIGRFDAADEAWIRSAAAHLRAALPRMRYLDQTATVHACRLLARNLQERYGVEELRRFRYRAVPRGGLIVLGWLAYLLGIPSSQIETSTRGEEPFQDGAAATERVVLVDDIAISGLRLARALETSARERVVVATLHSHPELRNAMLQRHDHLDAFVSAHDLTDHAPAALGTAYLEWLERWRARSVDGAVWVGQPDHVTYPWNEPDTNVWNDVTQRSEPAWRLVPPERCVKNRRASNVGVQALLRPVGSLRPHPDVIYGDIDGTVILGQLSTTDTYELDAVGADIWRALATSADRGSIVARLMSRYGSDERTAIRDVDAFVDELIRSGLVVDVRP